VRLRASDQQGFGLIELLMSMTMLNIGILALVAAFQSGAFALKRASALSTAAAIADIQMERYRAYKYCGILFTATDVTAAQADPTYTADAEYVRAPTQLTPANDPSCTGATPPTDSLPIQNLTGPDQKPYRADVYIVADTVTSGRPIKRVTVVIRDRQNLGGRPLARVASTFDQATGS
jgi:type II secretory pathway pseudopilin PulG